jgi:hypothetical protein
MDKYMFPEDKVLSAYLSLAQGFVCYFLLHFFNKSINAFILKMTMAEINKSLDECSLNNQLDDTHSVITAASRHLSEHKIDTSSSNHDDDQICHHNQNQTNSKQPPCCSTSHTIDECLSFDHYIKHIAGATEIHSPDLRENFEKARLSISNRVFLYFVFMVGFVGTVNLWRGLWELQLAYCYPVVFKDAPLLNQNMLNLIYMPSAILILWMLHLTSSLLSRASCQDDYFIAKENYIVKHNIFKQFFLKKVGTISFISY